MDLLELLRLEPRRAPLLRLAGVEELALDHSALIAAADFFGLRVA